jgi:hypothetical protein
MKLDETAKKAFESLYAEKLILICEEYERQKKERRLPIGDCPITITNNILNVAGNLNGASQVGTETSTQCIATPQLTDRDPYSEEEQAEAVSKIMAFGNSLVMDRIANEVKEREMFRLRKAIMSFYKSPHHSIGSETIKGAHEFLIEKDGALAVQIPKISLLFSIASGLGGIALMVYGIFLYLQVMISRPDGSSVVQAGLLFFLSIAIIFLGFYLVTLFRPTLQALRINKALKQS